MESVTVDYESVVHRILILMKLKTSKMFNLINELMRAARERGRRERIAMEMRGRRKGLTLAHSFLSPVANLSQSLAHESSQIHSIIATAMRV